MNQLIAQSRIIARCLIIGLYFAQKYRAQAQAGSVYQSAKNLKKQGVPCDVALLLLAHK